MIAVWLFWIIQYLLQSCFHCFSSTSGAKSVASTKRVKTLRWRSTSKYVKQTTHVCTVGNTSKRHCTVMNTRLSVHCHLTLACVVSVWANHTTETVDISNAPGAFWDLQTKTASGTTTSTSVSQSTSVNSIQMILSTLLMHSCSIGGRNTAFISVLFVWQNIGWRTSWTNTEGCVCTSEVYMHKLNLCVLWIFDVCVFCVLWVKESTIS